MQIPRPEQLTEFLTQLGRRFPQAARYDEPIKLRRNLAEFKRKLKP